MIQCLNCRGCPGLNNLPNTGAWQNWDSDYNSIVNGLQEIELLIVGQDPYKNRATGIAFCKPTWLELLDDQYSALTLFCSLGINVKKASFDASRFPTPKEFFIWLAENFKVIFVNAHNSNGRRVRESKIWLKKAKYSLLLGYESQKLHKNEDDKNFHIIHPSQYNENVNYADWCSAWGYHTSLLDTIKSKCQKFSSLQSYKEICTIVNNINLNL